VSAILQAMTNLNGAVSKLEAAAIRQEQKVGQLKKKGAAAPQIDLFSAPAVANANRGAYVADPAALARKLDVAIEKVEQILREA
jgi:hypothetical protein